MKWSEIKVGCVVEDKWWAERIIGRVVRKLKTRATIKLIYSCDTVYTRDGLMVYDRSHVQFLRKRQ